MIPDNIKKIIDEILDEALSEMDGATSTTASAGGEYTGKYFIRQHQNQNLLNFIKKNN